MKWRLQKFHTVLCKTRILSSFSNKTEHFQNLVVAFSDCFFIIKEVINPEAIGEGVETVLVALILS